MILVIFLYLVYIVEGIINPSGPTVINDFTNCMLQTIDIDFQESGLLVFADNNASTSVRRIRSKVLHYIHKSAKYSVEITSLGKEMVICGNDEKITMISNADFSKHTLKANYFVIIIDSYQDLYNLLAKFIYSTTWNPRAKFLILLYQFTSNTRINEEIIENLLLCFFKYNVVNIVFMVPQVNNIRNAIAYSWRPYDPPKYCGYKNETAKNRLRKENMCEKGVLKYKKKLFENRIPSDMKGCTLYVMTLERQPFTSADEQDPNIEKNLIDEILKIYNFKSNYEILQLNRGERDTGEWDGALKELILKKGNVLLGGIFPDFDVHEDFDYSSSYLADAFIWVVPRAHHSPRWVALTIIFKQTVWLTVLATFVVCAGVWKTIGALSEDSLYNKTFGHSFLNTWICTLGFCTYSRPKTDSLRTFFIFLNLYCVMCLTAYTAKLIDVLRNPTFEHQIKTVEELINSGLKFGGFEELHDIFNNSDDPIDSYVFEKYVTVEDISMALIDVAVHRNFSLLCSRLELAHTSAMIPELSDSFGKYKYYAFTTKVFSVPLEMLGLNGFPFMPQFTKTLGLLQQCGHSAQLRRFFSYYNLRKKAKLLRLLKIQQSEIDALSIQHLQGGFLALILGYTAGTTTLIIEIIINSEIAKHKIKRIKSVLKREPITLY